MKKAYLLLSCFILTHLMYGQLNSKDIDFLRATADSLFKQKDFNQSAQYSSAALRLKNGKAPLIRWETARAWAAANVADSAFEHLAIIADENRESLPGYDNILTDPMFTNIKKDPRWETIRTKLVTTYKKIAVTSSERARSPYWTNTTSNNHYDAAKAWAMFGEIDSAFNYLKKIIYTDNNVFIDYPQISEDNYMLSLHGDKRWRPLLDSVKKNWKWIRTGHSFTGPSIPMIATIEPGSKYLLSDGAGPYKHGVDHISSSDQHAYNLLLSGHAVWYFSGDRRDLSSRHISVDLNSPVEGSGAIARGLIRDNDLEFHVSYRMDTTVSPQVVYNLREIPVGVTIESERTEIDFYINNEFYTLTMGPWAFGRNNEAIAHKGRLNGKGTTTVKVTRDSETSYTVVAPEGSVARLWKTQNMTSPVDLGLYKTGFIIRLWKQ